MRRAVRAFAAAALFAAVGITGFAVAGPASADTEICDQYGTTTIGGKYVVMNNRWGTSARQCINVTSTGFTITDQQGEGSTSGAPVSYPAIYIGCHYTKCSPGTNLPMRVSDISSATSSIDYTYVSGEAIYDASYDIWLDPSPKTDGVNQQEIMIWFNRQGAIQPIGSVAGTATVAGRTWEVWTGDNGANKVISYVAPAAISSLSFSVLDFINDVKSRGSITASWYLTSIQAGFEPWKLGKDLAVTNFSAAVASGGAPAATTPATTKPTTAPATTQPTTPATTTPAGGTAACAISYSTNTWAGGYTASVTLANTGTTPLNGWTVGFTLPAGQTVSSAWNTTLAGTSGALTAKSLAWNSAIPAGGNASFGFNGTYSGSFAKPTAFTLNGSACSAA